jgi:integrase
MDEAWEFMRVAREHRNYAVHVLTLATGLRQGEVLGLRRRDVDFCNNTIKIEQTVSHDGKRFETPKTKKSKRIVSIDEQTMLVLRIQHNFILKEKNDADPETYQDFDLLFPTANGPRNLYREFSTIIQKAKLQHIRFHDLRHCHATYLLELDLHPKKVAERLGHADSRMMDRYSHVRADVNRQTADEFGKAFYSKQTVG